MFALSKSFPAASKPELYAELQRQLIVVLGIDQQPRHGDKRDQ